MIRVIDLLGIPSLDKGYLVAGYEGVFKSVKKIDIMEIPYPQAEKYLVPEEVMFTSFWSLKDDKDGRIKLVHAMIKHNCSGLAIMPSLHMNDIIDPEIIAIANEFAFPIIYVPATAHWSDVFSEYAILSHIKISDIDVSFLGILDDFSDLHIDKNIQKFCLNLEKRFSRQIILSVNDHLYYNEKNSAIAPYIISKAQNIKNKMKRNDSLPVSYQVRDKYLAMAYFGKHSILAICSTLEGINASDNRVLNKIAPVITKELDNLYNKSLENKALSTPRLQDNALYYVLFIKKENINSYLHKMEKKYVVFDENPLHHYVILLISDDSHEQGSSVVIKEFGRLVKEIEPELFVFSNTAMSKSELFLEIKQFEYIGNVLLFLRGVFCTAEMPLIYCLSCAPRDYKDHLLKYGGLYGNINKVDMLPLDTLRLYLVLKNVSDVALLLDIHYNSVKYRINKTLDFFNVDGANIKDLPSTKLLTLLELIKLEDIN